VVSLVDGYARAERLSWDNYHEGIDLKAQIEVYRDRYGTYPAAVCADKIYRTRDNLDFCKEHGIRLSGPKLGRPYKDDERRREIRRIERQDEGTRVAIEGEVRRREAELLSGQCPDETQEDERERNHDGLLHDEPYEAGTGSGTVSFCPAIEAFFVGFWAPRIREAGISQAA
jgi:hypothetical protein